MWLDNHFHVYLMLHKTPSLPIEEKISFWLRMTKLPCCKEVVWLELKGNLQKLRKTPRQLAGSKQKLLSKEVNSTKNLSGLEEDLKLQMKIEPADTFVLAMKCWAEDPVKVILELAIPLYSQVPFKRMRLWRFVYHEPKILGFSNSSVYHTVPYCTINTTVSNHLFLENLLPTSQQWLIHLKRLEKWTTLQKNKLKHLTKPLKNNNKVT